MLAGRQGLGLCQVKAKVWDFILDTATEQTKWLVKVRIKLLTFVPTIVSSFPAVGVGVGTRSLLLTDLAGTIVQLNLFGCGVTGICGSV